MSIAQREFVTAVADVAAMFPAYKSKDEAAWAGEGMTVLLGELHSHTAVQLYEPVTFNLPGNRYTPDFQHLLEDGRIVYVEIKGSKHQKGYRDARSKLRAAAELHPWFTWIEARQERGSWIVEVIK